MPIAELTGKPMRRRGAKSIDRRGDSERGAEEAEGIFAGCAEDGGAARESQDTTHYSVVDGRGMRLR